MVAKSLADGGGGDFFRLIGGEGDRKSSSR